MKTVIFAIAIAAFLLVVSILVGFSSPTQKVDAAQRQLQKAKIGLDLAQASANIVVVEEGKIEASKTEIWACELAIQKNNNHIKEINSKLTNDGSVLDDLYEARRNAMEMKNYRMKKRIAAIENEQSTWTKIKGEFNKDAVTFGNAVYVLVFEKRN